MAAAAALSPAQGSDRNGGWQARVVRESFCDGLGGYALASVQPEARH